MNNISYKCDTEMISRFYDKELEPDEYIRVKEHIHSCNSCREILNDLENISEQVKEHLSDSVLKTQFAGIEGDVINCIRHKEKPWFFKLINMLISKKMLVPATAMASIILVFAIFFRTPVSSGPSAIVSSLSGDSSSVIIMETPNTRQTILWFNEPKLAERRKI
jgi:hypothetical protein